MKTNIFNLKLVLVKKCIDLSDHNNKVVCAFHLFTAKKENEDKNKILIIF